MALRFENLYRRRSKVLDFNVLRRILTGSCLAILILIALTFFRKSGEFSRLFTMLMFFYVVLALLINRITLHYLFQWMMLSKGVGQSKTIIVGQGPIVEQIASTLSNHPERGMTPVGIVISDENGEKRPSSFAGLPIFGVAQELESILTQSSH